MYRVGIGYDYHRLAEGRRLVLGGVEIPFEKGLLGHSDADVLAHAMSDALLGAAALGDIGRRFPDSDPEYKNASSLKLLAEVGRILAGQNWEVVNIDAVIIAERPRLAPFIPQMLERLAEALGLEPARLSIKAKTAEGADSIGRGEGIAAQAVALIRSRVS